MNQELFSTFSSNALIAPIINLFNTDLTVRLSKV